MSADLRAVQQQFEKVVSKSKQKIEELRRDIDQQANVLARLRPIGEHGEGKPEAAAPSAPTGADPHEMMTRAMSLAGSDDTALRFRARSSAVSAQMSLPSSTAPRAASGSQSLSRERMEHFDHFLQVFDAAVASALPPPPIVDARPRRNTLGQLRIAQDVVAESRTCLGPAVLGDLTLGASPSGPLHTLSPAGAVNSIDNNIDKGGLSGTRQGARGTGLGAGAGAAKSGSSYEIRIYLGKTTKVADLDVIGRAGREGGLFVHLSHASTTKQHSLLKKGDQIIEVRGCSL